MEKGEMISPFPFSMSKMWSKRYSLYYRMGQHYCAGCGKWFDFDHMTVDHRVPKSKGGVSSLDNLQLMCAPCNHEKGDHVPAELCG